MIPRVPGLLVVILLATAWLSVAPIATARQVQGPPGALDGVGVDEKLDTRIPLDLRFRDHNGRAVTLGDFFRGDLPVILTLNYSSCPMLCSLQLEGLVDKLNEIDLALGTDYRIVTVSIDPDETPLRAREAFQKYMQRLDDPVPSAWRFLVGKQGAIDAIATATGFRYKYLANVDEYAHAAVTMILTPKGRLSRYLYDVNFDPYTLRLSLVEASKGKIGSTVDRFLLFCFRYDPDAGSYALAAKRLMTAGGLITVAAVGIFLFVHLRRERKATRALAERPARRPSERAILEGGTSS